VRRSARGSTRVVEVPVAIGKTLASEGCSPAVGAPPPNRRIS